MKRIQYLWLFLLSFGLSAANGQAGNCDPDSLQEITISGTVSIAATGENAKYFLATETETYILNFGPWWYQPATGDALRPGEGSYIQIYGGLNTTNPGTYPVIVVYEIDGMFWRNPFDPGWNHFNNDYSPDPATFDQGIACGWPDCNVTTSVYTGMVMIDTTLVFYHYFLDTDLDGLPDYRLNFGPPWYEPPGDVNLPEAGDFVMIEGGVVHVNVYPIIIVFTIDGETWRDESGFGPGDMGKWMHGNQNAGMTIQSPFDARSRIQLQDGWHGNGLPASMFCQLLELHHQNMFQHENMHAFAGFQVACFNGQRENLMNTQQFQHGMTFKNQVQLQLHFTQAQMDRYRIRNRDRIRLHYWDRQTATWMEEGGLIVDTTNHIVTLYTESLQAWYLLSAEQTTGESTPVHFPASSFLLTPNPADLGITLEFTVPLGHAEITLVNAEGRVVSAQRVSDLAIGSSVFLSTTGWPPGLYYLRLSNGNRVEGRPVAIQR